MPKAKQPDMFDGMAAPPGPIVEEAKAIWNEHATQYKWKACKVLDKARQTSIKRAVGDYGGITGWRDALASVAKNRFVQGLIAPREGYKQFVANIDWFCRPVTVRKVLEDFYEDEGADKKSGSQTAAQAAETELEKWGRWLRNYKPGRFWPSSQGERPEDAACKCPASLLEWWRKQNNVVLVERPKESAAERAQATITSLRNAGRWDLANAREQKQADLEGRPAVLVPAPDVAHLSSTNTPARKPPRTFTDAPEISPADREAARRHAFEASHEPPPWSGTDIPESEYETIEPD